eukprot:GHRQ01026864.1.p2 GENE.GHRQ01026864.1~~GHRQ01026864.1.p2  ORF type:complete len:165 (-),score=39.32 GHRQ01026864.1:335-829(-)
MMMVTMPMYGRNLHRNKRKASAIEHWMLRAGQQQQQQRLGQQCPSTAGDCKQTLQHSPRLTKQVSSCKGAQDEYRQINACFALLISTSATIRAGKHSMHVQQPQHFLQAVQSHALAAQLELLHNGCTVPAPCCKSPSWLHHAVRNHVQTSAMVNQNELKCAPPA